MKTKRGKTKVNRPSGATVEDAFNCRGLGLHRVSVRVGLPGEFYGPGWGVTHVESGHGVGPVFRTMREARAFMSALLGMDMDWRRPAVELRKLTGLRAMVERAVAGARTP